MNMIPSQQPEPKPSWASLRTSRNQCRATQLYPRYDRLFPGEPVAIDTEMVNHSRNEGKKYKRVGRVSVTKISGETVLDVFCFYPKEDGLKKTFDPPKFGVEFGDLQPSNGAVPIEEAVLWLTSICKDRRVIMHSARNDLNAFGEYAADIFRHSDAIDTQSRSLYGVRNLPDLALQYLNKHIQDVYHSSVEDAQVTGELWVLATGYDRDAAFQDYMIGTNMPALGDISRKAAKQPRSHQAQTESAPTPGLEGQASTPFPGQSSTSQSGPSTLTIHNYGTIVGGPAGQATQKVVITTQKPTWASVAAKAKAAPKPQNYEQW
ncbi:hypothetical protein CKM354_001052200 [Cercospora kikuchii]|uniref:Exonuclease domain-containing protein n=1 Tax=Cercospora kikuchii TaxID=84275 RepID=A0A9P3FHD4_9PEZI|nr:uncharacterized protein CKM354_001052200 [Cercospora kikuchii]GIZ47431.1 hypothetical protein CKM354_001052200 [Cercospora kikuchii]